MVKSWTVETRFPHPYALLAFYNVASTIDLLFEITSCQTSGIGRLAIGYQVKSIYPWLKGTLNI